MFVNILNIEKSRCISCEIIYNFKMRYDRCFLTQKAYTKKVNRYVIYTRIYMMCCRHEDR